MKNWRRKGDRVVTRFDRHEAAMLRGLISQIDELLTARSEQAPRDELSELTGIRVGPSSAPADPVLARLLPDFHRLDAEDAAGYADSAAALRSLHEPELLEHKAGVANIVLTTLPAGGGSVNIGEETAASWLAALNDVRLALGTSLGVTEDFPDQLPADDPRSGHLNVYHWLTWMQDSLLRALA